MTAAAFQSTVNYQLGSGVPGEFYMDGPQLAQSFILNSASAAYNVFGRGFSKLSQGVAAAGNSGGTAQFAGILCSPKTHPLYGDGVNPLNPSFTLPNAVNADLVTEGQIWVTLPADCALGDLVVYDNTTGALSTIAPGADLPVGKSFAFAFVDVFTPNAGTAQLAVITLQPTLPIPVLAGP